MLTSSRWPRHDGCLKSVLHLDVPAGRAGLGEHGREHGGFLGDPKNSGRRRYAATLILSTIRLLDFSGGGRQMEYSDYLREQAAEYRQLAEEAEDPAIKQDLFETAAVCEEVADNVDYRRTSG